jgi:hypothetical protein
MVNSEEFLLKLKSNLSPVATRDERALAALDAQIRAATRAMAGLDTKAATAAAQVAAQEQKVQAASAALRKAQAGVTGSSDVAQVRAMQARLAKEEASLTSLRGKSDAAARAAGAGKIDLSKLKAARPELAAQAASAKRWKEGFTQAGAAIHALGGPLSTWLSKMQTLAPLTELGATAVISLGAYALAAVLVAGLAGAYLGLVRFGLAAAAARRDAMILGDALTGVSRRPGQEFVAVVDQLARRVPLARDKLQEMAKEMALLRLGGRDLQAGLTATAMVTSALGDAAGRNVRSIVEQSQAIRRFTLGARDIRGEFTALAGTGLTKADVLGALAKQLGRSIPDVERALLLGQIKLKDGLKALEAASRSRFGSTVAAQMLDVDTQLSKAKENFASLFNGVNLTPALEAMKGFLDVFDEGTVTGKTLKFLVNTGMQAIVDTIAAGLPIAKDFFGGMVDGALELYIAIAPTVYRVGKFLSTLLGAQKSFDALDVGKAVFYALAAAAVIVGASIALAMLPVVVVGGLIYASIKAVVAIFGELKSIYTFVKGAIDASTDELGNLDWSGLGVRLIQGLIKGVASMGGAFVSTIKDLALSGLHAFSSTNEIHSPAGAYRRLGRYIPPGAAGGVDDAAPLLGRSVADMSAAAMPQVNVTAPAVNVSAGGSSSGGVVVNFNAPVSLGGGESKEAFGDWLIARITGARMGGAAEAT